MMVVKSEDQNFPILTENITLIIISDYLVKKTKHKVQQTLVQK